MVTTNFGWAEVSASQNQKEVTINDVTNKIEDAMSENEAIAIGVSNAHTFTSTEYLENFFFVFTDDGAPPTATITLTCPATKRGVFMVINDTSFTINVSVSGQSEPVVGILSGESSLISCDGVDTREAGGGGGASDFLSLTDTPGSFAGQAGLSAVVNQAENAIEFTSITGGGSTAVAVNPVFRGAMVKKSANQTNVAAIGFPGTVLSWDQEEYDTDDIHDNSTNNTRLTVPAGVTRVRLSANVEWVPEGTGPDRAITMQKNGSEIIGLAQALQGQSAAANRQRQNIISAVMTVVATDYFEVFAWSSQTDQDDVVGNDPGTWFTMEIIETSDTAALPTAFLAVEPAHKSARVKKTGTQALTGSAENLVIWADSDIDETFQPDDLGGPQRIWLGVDFNFVDGDVTTGTDTIAETAHGFTTGEGPFRMTSSGTLPAGLALATNYWAIAVDANNFKVASSRNNALADTPVDITAAAGGGTHTIDKANRLVVPKSVSKIRMTVGLDTSTPSSGVHQTWIAKNGTTAFPGIIMFGGDITGTGSEGHNLHSGVLDVVEGDYFEIITNPVNTGSLDNTAATFFQLEVVQSDKPLSFPGITVERPFIGVMVQLDSDITSLNLTTPNPPGQIIPWESVIHGNDYRGVAFAEFSTNPERITVPAGVTKVRVGGTITVTSYTGASTVVRLLKNGNLSFVETATQVVGSSTFSDAAASVSSGIMEVVEGDYFELAFLGSTDTSANVASNRSNFWMEVVETTEAAAPPLDLSFFFGGVPGAGIKMGKHVATRRFTLNDELLNSQAHADTVGTVGVADFDVERNGSSIGTISFAVSSNTATFVTAGGTPEVFEIGDRLTVITPNPANAALADIAITLFGFRS